ncbi:brain and acute leukemia cytoplasmic protein isoform X1 [Heterocephalus glaber]|uniref:Brain and acute leukemia cytoplasmic protein isoform X1 n=1 Tax=Heterocephalus glaber TaxID=10181 RepID=A0AAX6TF41_HETGA|nr:brain and acute leukemia cytoplasmic protein isoform X1 [Heterocephalus glaber]XP_021118406.1 brain and acute leukemia cytoplasmic protein isoform X1 [Heterocephalus glaber]
MHTTGSVSTPRIPEAGAWVQEVRSACRPQLSPPARCQPQLGSHRVGQGCPFRGTSPRLAVSPKRETREASTRKNPPFILRHTELFGPALIRQWIASFPLKASAFVALQVWAPWQLFSRKPAQGQGARDRPSHPCPSVTPPCPGDSRTLFPFPFHFLAQRLSPASDQPGPRGDGFQPSLPAVSRVPVLGSPSELLRSPGRDTLLGAPGGLGEMTGVDNSICPDNHRIVARGVATAPAIPIPQPPHTGSKPAVGVVGPDLWPSLTRVFNLWWAELHVPPTPEAPLLSTSGLADATVQSFHLCFTLLLDSRAGDVAQGEDPE